MLKCNVDMAIILKIFGIVLALTLAIFGIMYVMGFGSLDEVIEFAMKALIVEVIVFITLLIIKFITK